MAFTEKKITPCDISIDKEGIWYYKGDEIIRTEIIRYFYNILKRDESGRYIIEYENESCYLEVEDTPFVVKTVNKKILAENNGEECINLLLSDQSLDQLNPQTLWVGKDNVLYCTIKNNAFVARFSRASYYQITDLPPI
jgi:hypothetical protein